MCLAFSGAKCPQTLPLFAGLPLCNSPFVKKMRDHKSPPDASDRPDQSDKPDRDNLAPAVFNV
jgi:hypothetical protein